MTDVSQTRRNAIRLIGAIAAAMVAFSTSPAAWAQPRHPVTSADRHRQAEELRRGARALQAQAKLLLSNAAAARRAAAAAHADKVHGVKAMADLRGNPAFADAVANIKAAIKRDEATEARERSEAVQDDARARWLLARARQMLAQANALEGKR